MNRAERRAAQFGNFSYNRRLYQYTFSYTDFPCIQADIEYAADERIYSLSEMDYDAWAGQSIIAEDNI